MNCFTKDYCIELARQEKYSEAIHQAYEIGLKNKNYADLEDITSPIFEMMKENCQKLVDKVNYTEAYNIWNRARTLSFCAMKTRLENFSISELVTLKPMPGFLKIKDFINRHLVNFNDFERVCMEIDELEPGPFRNLTIEELAEVYFENERLNEASELINMYNVGWDKMMRNKINFALDNIRPRGA